MKNKVFPCTQQILFKLLYNKSNFYNNEQVGVNKPKYYSEMLDG